MATAELSELQKLERLVGEPITRVIKINGQDVEFLVKRVKLGKIPKLVRAAGTLMNYLTNDSLELNFKSLLTFHADECLELIAVLTDQPRAVIDELDADDGLMLLTDAIEQNIDFFVHRVLPVLSGALRRMFEDAAKSNALLTQVIGQRSSNTSSSTGTESQKSGSTPT
jgi:hypothetical protein